MSTKTLDFSEFMSGRIVTKKHASKSESEFWNIASTCIGIIGGGAATIYEMHGKAFAGDGAIAVLAPNDAGLSIPAMSSDAGWADPVLRLLEHQGLPLALVMGVWACLEAIVGRPAGAIERLKWAVIGYLALRYVPGFITGLAH